MKFLAGIAQEVVNYKTVSVQLIVVMIFKSLLKNSVITTKDLLAQYQGATLSPVL